MPIENEKPSDDTPVNEAQNAPLPGTESEELDEEQLDGVSGGKQAIGFW